MFEVRKPVVRAVCLGLAAAGLAGFSAAAKAQVARPPVHHRETNASREARIRRTVDDTYSHRWDVFGGGGYMRFRSGDVTKKNNEVTWEMEPHYYLNPKLAIVGDFRGMFGHAHATNFNGAVQIPNPQINEYTFMGGGSYRFYRTEKLSASVEGLFGGGWGIFSGGSKGLPGGSLGLWPDGWAPAFSAGLDLDYNFFPNLAFRVKPTYVGTTFGSGVQNNFGFNMGVIYRFGRQVK